MPHGEDLNPRAGPPAPVLVVSADAARRAMFARALGDTAAHAGVPCRFAASTDEASGMLDPRRPYAGVVLDVPACTPATLRFVRVVSQRDIPAVLVCPTVSFDEAVEAMRAGAADIVGPVHAERDLRERLRRALRGQAPHAAPAPTPHAFDADDDLATDPSLPAAHAASEEWWWEEPPMSDIPTPPTPPPPPPGSKPSADPRAGRGRRAAPARKAGPLEHGPASADDLAQQFKVLITGELDVESLLRQLLEFILAHAGATNAAVFLPGTAGDYALGAYVNYSCPRDAAEVLLDHLANVAAPKLESTAGVITLRGRAELEDRLGEGAEWLGDQHLLAFTCRAPAGSASAGECLAVVTLFRDPSNPFQASTPGLLARLSDVFGAQLARVVRIHHRHLPRDQWGNLGDPPTDDDRGGLAA